MRPILHLEKFDSDGDLENFQNETLRPILKMQHNILLDFLLQQKNIEDILTTNSNKNSLELKLKSFINQPHLKDTFMGMIIGHFTPSELKFYGEHFKDVKKRISQMLLERLVNTV